MPINVHVYGRISESGHHDSALGPGGKIFLEFRVDQESRIKSAAKRISFNINCYKKNLPKYTTAPKFIPSPFEETVIGSFCPLSYLGPLCSGPIMSGAIMSGSLFIFIILPQSDCT